MISKEAYDDLHFLEEKYGSIARVPENEPHFVKLKEMMDQEHTASRGMNALKMLQDGFTEYEAAIDVGLTVNYVKKLRQSHHIPIVPKFNYIVNDTYFASREAIAKYYEVSNYRVFEFLRIKDLKIVMCKMHWKDIPINARYVVDKRVYVKKKDSILSFKS